MRKIQTVFSALTGICLAVVFAVTFGQVIQRYVFQLPMPWATDVIRIFFVYSVFLGMGVGVFKKAHLNIDVLIQIMPQGAKPYFDLLSNCVVLVFLSVVLRFSVTFTLDNIDQVTPYLLFPMGYVYGVIPLTVVFMVIFLVIDTLKLIGGMMGRRGSSPSSGR